MGGTRGSERGVPLASNEHQKALFTSEERQPLVARFGPLVARFGPLIFGFEG